MPDLDVKTLFLIWSLGSLLFFLIFILYALNYKIKNSSIYLYLTAKLLQFLAFYMFAVRTPVTSGLTIFFNNFFLTFGLANEIYALKNAVHKFNLKDFLILNISSLVMMIYYALIIDKSGNFKVIVMSYVLAVLFIIGFILFIRIRGKNNFINLTSLLFLLITFSMIARGINAQLSSSIALFNTNYIQNITYLSFFIITYLLPIIFLLYLKEKDLEQISEFSKRYQSQITISGTGAWEYDPLSEKLWCSPEYYLMLGYQKAPPVNPYDYFHQYWKDLIHPSDYDRVVNAFNSFIKTNNTLSTFESIYRLKHQNNHWLWIRTKAQFLPGENQNQSHKIIGAHFDISESKHKEEALLTAIRTAKENENFAMGFIMQSPISVLVFDHTGQTILVNEAWKKLWQTSFEMVINKYNVLQDPYIKELGWYEFLEKAFQGETISFPISEYDPVRNGFIGHKKILKCLAFPIVEDKDVKRVIMIQEDVTEQRKAEQELIETNLHLEKARIEANELALQAKKASQAKTEFLANMSHEIRTPLNSVVGFMRLLSETELNSEQKQCMDNALTSSKALMEVVNDILDFTKIEAGKLEIEEIPTDLIALIEEVSDIIKYHADKKNLHFIMKLPPDCPKLIHIDPVRVKQILLNLMNNAIKFTNQGEVELSLEYSPAINNNKTAQFTFIIRDTGIGISENQKLKLFQAFTQADSSTTRKYGGTGLGLIISSNLIHLMGSKLYLNSDLNQGSVFSFTLQKNIIEDSQEIQPDLSDKSALLIASGSDSMQELESMLNFYKIKTKLVKLDSLYELWKEEGEKYHYLFINHFTENTYCLNILSSLNTYRPFINSLEIVLLQKTTDKVLNKSELLEHNIQYVFHKPVKLTQIKSLILNKGQEYEKSPLNTSVVLSEIKKHVLIAEDVPMNRMLLISIIKKVFPLAEISEAKNGYEAVNHFLTDKPDLILMDVQMPEMDGYTATEKIRVIEKIKDQRIPIIALTAGVIQGDREKCLEAGMDDYLTKPVEPDKLIQTMKKYLLTEEEKVVIIPEKVQDNKSDHHNKEKFLNRCGFDQEFCQEIIDLGMIQLDEDMQQLYLALENLERNQIRSLAHKIKGTAVNLSADLLAKNALLIEKSYEVDIEHLTSMIDNLNKEFLYLKNILFTQEFSTQ